MGSESYHEPFDLISDSSRDLHRGITSLVEEFEAVDWYQQRADVTSDGALRRVLEHNRDEEIEHACMILEWLRRRMPKLDEELRTYLFTEGEITAQEAEATGQAGDGGGEGGDGGDAGPTVGPLRGR